MSKALTVSRLNKTFPSEKKGGVGFKAVTNVSFSLELGEILGLLGPNGAGKSTTISMLLGVLTPTSGKITYFGKDLDLHRSEILNQVTFASTYIRMPWRLTVWENLRIYALMYGVDYSTFGKRAEKFLTKFGVWNQVGKTMNELSAGQTTRVMLAKAFIPHPKIVLLDEPTASLDPDMAHQVRGFVKEQRQEYGTSILYTSHNMDEVADVCDRVMFLKSGQIIATDTPANLAKSVSTARMQLWVKDGMKRAQKLAQELGYQTTITDRSIEIKLDEQQIASFLHLLAEARIEYTQIAIAKPNLEDYFLKMSHHE